MTIYARVSNGIVQELWSAPSGQTPTTCFVASIAGQFVETPSEIAVMQGWTYNGSTFASPIVATPTLAQQAATMLVVGIEIVSTGAPTLNGTYAVNLATYQRITGIVAAIAGGLGLPGGAATFNWLDTVGTPHQFNATQFGNFAKAVMDFDYILNTVIGSNSGTLPTLPVTIP
jgi:hypothetical protein